MSLRYAVTCVVCNTLSLSFVGIRDGCTSDHRLGPDEIQIAGGGLMLLKLLNNPRVSRLPLTLFVLVTMASCASSPRQSQTELTSIDVTAASMTLTIGATQQATATGHFSDGTTQDLTAVAGWSSQS